MQKLQALALDLDGTLLTSQGQISPRTLTYLRGLQKQGVTLILASGRMTKRMLPFAREIGAPITLIAYNGARVIQWHGDENLTLLRETEIPDSVRAAVLNLCERENLFLNIYSHDLLVGYHPAADFQSSRFYQSQNGANYAGFFHNQAETPKTGLAKLLIITEILKRDALYDFCLQELGNSCSVLKSNPEYLEFMAPGITKGAAIRWWLKEQNVTSDHVAAFGDAENDLDMLQTVGHGFAVANATPGLLRDYSQVSRFSNDQDVIVEELDSRFRSKDL
jgi:Cof subfamily protein (haloacid dehalogenase superfamily)